MSIRVNKSHQGVLLQDFGRFGQAHIGVTTGGPADTYAYSWANKLLNNPINSSVIEMTLGQASFTVQQSTWFAISGADLNATLDTQPLQNWSSFYAMKGQVINFKLPRNGLRGYLAVSGGFAAPDTLGSASTVVRDKLGGLRGNGSSIGTGDELAFRTKISRSDYSTQSVSFRFVPDYNRPIHLRIIPGYQVKQFSPAALSHFYQQEYIVSKDSNRMGYRFEGRGIDAPNQGILSEGLALGSIQITPDGLPIVMLCDHQTIGGYPKVGCVSQVDLPRLAQARPGQSVYFQPGVLKELQAAWCQWALFFGY
ncbi:5-oxoprolinase/urea amidolyase family protein [Vibrio astriarenae]|uniref:5-oxoprolinase/urea amidolyase family protein n=1 Tax=Vibrio astriarenae TaxID=1481923 RepID=A0A7Z2T6M3_9VIBR|nr:biotin-dependent carboxyltransferase family protein [Vibrio astriarenae]QIA65292.1 5-oxoprolinase/urea amidolyase family protein [Vibrio astriarenae]